MSRLTVFFKSLRTRGRIRRHLQADLQPLGAELGRLGLRFSRSSPFYYDCKLSRSGPRYGADFIGPDFSRIVYRRASTFLYWLWRCPPEVASITVNLSDGDRPSGAQFAGSVREPGTVALPDPYFFHHRGFEAQRHFAGQESVPWPARSAKLRWRGATTGGGLFDRFSPESAWNPEVLQRLRMVLILRGQPDCDVVFSGSDRSSAHKEALLAHQLVGEPIQEGGWLGDKFALDVHGYANTWSNFLVRLHHGCCVIKVESQAGYRQWYYDRIRPWEHFVPVRADMSDLVEKIDWARSHDAEACRIAENGQAFARSMTFEREAQWAVNAICTANGVSPV